MYMINKYEFARIEKYSVVLFSAHQRIKDKKAICMLVEFQRSVESIACKCCFFSIEEKLIGRAN